MLSKLMHEFDITMKALSIKQPWAEMILQGLKKIEVRSWRTDYRGDLLICSSAKPDESLLTMRPTIVHSRRGIWCDDSDPNDCDYEGFFQFGKALFITELYDIQIMTAEHEIDACCGSSPGFYSWMLRNVRPIQPFPIKGQLKIFEINYHE